MAGKKAVNGERALRDRLLDMGLAPGTEVMVRKVAPMRGFDRDYAAGL